MPREWLIQHRAGTLAEWAAAEASGPVLLAGERAYITDLNLDVVGDGVTKVASLGAVGSGTYAEKAGATYTGAHDFTAAVVTGISGGGSGSATLPGAIPNLSRWWQKLAEARQGGPSPVMVYVGDSTSIGANTAIDQLTYPHTRSGEPLEGLAADSTHIVAGGNNGYGGAFWLSQTGSGIPGSNYHPIDVINLNPDLIVLSFGINDVRTGTTTLPQLEAFLENVVTWRNTNLPNAGLVLRMPNPLLTTDASGAGYVSPNSSAQAYTDIMFRAYSNIRQRYADVVVVDTMTRIFGRTCRPNSTYMTDQLHPNGVGYAAVVDEIVKVIGIPQYQSDARDPVRPAALRDLNKRALISGGTVVNKALTSNVATLTTAAAHGLKPGQIITVAIGDPVFDGVQTLTGTPTSTALTYAKTNADVASTAVTTAAVIRRPPAYAEHPAVLDNPESFRLVMECNAATIDAGNNRIITGPLDGGVNNDAALVGIVQTGDIVRFGENYVLRPSSLGYAYSGSAGLLNGGPAGWLNGAPTTSKRIRIYRPVAEMDERMEYAWKLGTTMYPYARMFRITAGTNGTVTVQNDYSTGASVRPANECYFDAGDKMYVPGDSASTGRTFTVSVRQNPGGNITFAVAGVDFTNLVGKPIVIVGNHDPETGRRRNVSVDPAAIAAGATLDIDVTVTGADPNVHHLNWQPPALTAGLVIGFVRIKAADTITIRLYNPTGAAIDEPSGAWAFWLMR